MSYKIIFSFISLCFIWGCNSRRYEESVELKTLHLNPQKASNTILVSEIASGIKYVPLYTDNENLIGEIDKISYENNSIYISDRLSLYKYALDGTLLAKIAKRGGGPGEYINITDFQIDSDDMVWILCRNTKHLYKYDWDNKIKESILLDNWVNNIYLADNDNIYLYIGNEIDNNNKSRLKCFNLKTERIIREYLDIDSKQAKYLHAIGGRQFYKNEHSSYFFELFNDTVYTITEKDISPAYYVNFDNKNIPKSFYDIEYNDVMDFFQALSKKTYAYGIPLFAKLKEKCVLTYYYDQKCFMCVINEENGLVQSFSSLREDSEFGGFPIDLTDLSISINGNNLILPLIPSDIIEYAKENLSEEQYLKIVQKLNYKNQDQNPVIILIQI